ncbi:MAG: N-acetylmuramate alpha-1-phosphate uridylyltransferase MurU [Gammaproteobacteria bacterium]
MKAMILAAGKGARMRPVTDTLPKPLLKVGGKALIRRQVERLVAAGVRDIVVNCALHGEQIEGELGDGSALGAAVSYSHEGTEPLETGGGVLKALPLLGAAPFIVANADLWTDYPYIQLSGAPQGLAHLVLVGNPPHHPWGDFTLRDGCVFLEGAPRYTFSGIGVYRPELFDDCAPGRFGLAAVLRHAIAQGLVSGELYRGAWTDVGTPQRLAELNASLAAT